MTDLHDSGTERFCIGPLAQQVEGFSAFLAHEGYAPDSVDAKVQWLVDLSRWLGRHKLHAVQLDEERVKRFQIGRRRRGAARRGDAAVARQLLGYLRDLGCTPERSDAVDESPLERILRNYGRSLTAERGLTSATLINYIPTVRRFLLDCFDREAPRPDKLVLGDIHRFIVREAQRVSRSRAKLSVTALRSFFRFLHQRGTIAVDLAAAIPTVANWRLSHLPKSLPAKQVEQLLASCDRSTPIGRRDYAILLLLARLGLRAGEVLGMTLEDLDWEKGELLVLGKGNRVDRLPLPEEVGAAVAHYLRHVRLPCTTRRVFVRMTAPRRGFFGPAAICDVVRHALKRAALNPEFKGAHLLRHSLATDLLRKG